MVPTVHGDELCAWWSLRWLRNHVPLTLIKEPGLIPMYQVSVSSLFPVLTPSSNTFSRFHPRKFSRCNFYKTPRCHANRTLLIFFQFHRTSKLTQGKKMKRFKIPNFHPRKILKKSRESWFKNFPMKIRSQLQNTFNFIPRFSCLQSWKTIFTKKT